MEPFITKTRYVPEFTTEYTTLDCHKTFLEEKFEQYVADRWRPIHLACSDSSVVVIFERDKSVTEKDQ